MEKPLSNSVNMIRTTLSYLTNNPTPTAGITAFAGVKTTADNKLILIDGLNQIASGTSKGVTLDTNQIRTTMCDIAFKVGSAVSAYAASVNNNTLRLKVSYSRSAFDRFKKDEVDDICQTIHDEADAHIALAGAFGYVAADVTDLQTAINLYRVSVQDPRQAIISKGQAIANIKLLVREIVGSLFVMQMDKMVNTLLATQANFVKGYFLARETINLGSTTAKVRGTVKDELDVPLIGVKFVIRKTGTNIKIGETLTKPKGTFGIADIPAGDYDFAWSFNGYQTVTETNVHIAAGKELQRKIKLQQNVTPVVQHINVGMGQIVTLLNNVTPGNPASIYLKNTTPTPVTLNIYFAPNASTPFSGTGLTLTSGQEVTVNTSVLAPIQPFLLVQNNSPLPGTLDFNPL